jgi:surface antigen
MRPEPGLASACCGLIAAFTLAAVVVLAPDLVNAGSGSPATGSPVCDCIDRAAPDPAPLSRSSSTGELGSTPRPKLDDRDRVAALEAVQLALSEVGDGSAYVWYSRNGRISGVVHPTASFKDARGRICRQVVVSLSAGAFSREREGVACRANGGVWQLEG